MIIEEIGRLNPTHKKILQAVGAETATFLGSGATTRTYDIGRGRVVRIFDHTNMPFLEAHVAFYTDLHRYRFPFALPDIEQVVRLDDCSYIVEKRLPGRDMSLVFPTLDKQQRQVALRSFLAVLPHLRQVTLPNLPYGELLGWQGDITAVSWPQFLQTRTERNLVESLPLLREDMPQIDRLVADFWHRVETLPPAPKRLVHGDYFFGNVMCDERGEITAVFDFSPLTVNGDPVMDLSGALDFLNVYDFVTNADRQFMQQLIVAEYGEVVLAQIALYTTYYGLYFANAKTWQPEVYRWCLYHLRRYPFL